MGRKITETRKCPFLMVVIDNMVGNCHWETMIENDDLVIKRYPKYVPKAGADPLGHLKEGC